MSQNGLPIQALLQMLAQQQGQQPEQMSQQGQFNPADIQAQMQSNPPGGPQPFSFAPVQGGIGRNILNALANAGKAATYVAEDPRERERDDARAQQLYEAKQKMMLAAGEFGQREQDRKAQAAQRQQDAAERKQHWDALVQVAQQRADAQPPHTIETDKGPLQWDPKTKQFQPVTLNGQPVGPKVQPKPDTPEQQFFDSPEEKGKSMTQKVADYAKVSQKPEQPQKPPQQLAIGPDNKVYDLKPGMTVSQGTRTVTSELGKPSADEQRRADLAENMNENLNQLEEIVNKRPELFGQYGAGLLTSLKGKIGTGDPDIAKLEAIKEYLGMASVGAHSMRNAQHVGAAADAVMAGFRNSPEAMKAAIKVARDSTATFSKDIQRSQGAGAPPQQQTADPFAAFGGQKR